MKNSLSKCEFWTVIGENFSEILMKGKEILFTLVKNSKLSKFELLGFYCITKMTKKKVRGLKYILRV